MNESRKRVLFWLNRLAPLIGLVGVFLLFTALVDDPGRFADSYNIGVIARQTTIVGIAAIGMTMVIIAGGIDLSVGSIIALSSVVVALVLKQGHGPLAAVVAGVGAGALCGFVNGLLITALRVVPFIVTLGTLLIVRGVTIGLADKNTVTPGQETWLPDLTQARGPAETGDVVMAAVLGLVIALVGAWLVKRRGGSGVVWKIAGLVLLVPPFVAYVAVATPPGVHLMLGLAVFIALVLRYTRLGRHTYAVGSNEATARLCGVRVERVKIWVYTISAAFAGLAGVMQFARLNVGDPTAAQGAELDVIAAVVIGGGSLAGGEGSVAGTIVGALIMTVIAVGCQHMGWENWSQMIVTGGIIVLAVALDRLRHRRSA